MLKLHPVPGKEKSKLICRAFETGAPRDAKGRVFFGTEGVMDAWMQAKRDVLAGIPFYYCDNAYFDQCRGQYFRVTRNALQVDPRGIKSDGERFRRLKIDIKPWRTDLGETVLVIPQSDAFMKSTLGKVGDWTGEAVKTLREFGVPDKHIKVRPWMRDKPKAYVELRADLASSRLVVTWSSASAITALLEGVPAISASGSAHVLTGGLTRENVFAPKRPSDAERLEFASVLADGQFTLDEFRDDTAWRALERRIATTE
jgi:hypothetical protein